MRSPAESPARCATAWIPLLLAAGASAQGDVGKPPAAATLLAALHERIGAGIPTGLEVRGVVDAYWVTAHASTPFGKGTFEEVHDTGGRRLLRVDLPGVGSYRWGSDGKTSWRVEPMGGPSLRRGREALVDSLLSGLLVGDVEWNRYLSSEIRHARRDGRGIYELRMRRDEPEPDVWRLDAVSGLPCEVLLRTQDGLMQNVAWHVTVRRYEKHGPRLYPRERTFRERHLELRFKVEKIATAVDHEDGRFRLTPAELKAANRRRTDVEAKLLAKRAPVIRLADLRDQHALMVRVKVKPSEISLTFAQILPDVMTYLNRLGVKPSGPPFSIYYSFARGQVDLAAGFPVAKRVAGEGRIKPVLLAATRAAITWHVGPYHELSTTHERLKAWIAKRGLATAAPLREIYWTDPGLEPDPRHWRTEMILPVEPGKKDVKKPPVKR